MKQHGLTIVLVGITIVFCLFGVFVYVFHNPVQSDTVSTSTPVARANEVRLMPGPSNSHLFINRTPDNTDTNDSVIPMVSQTQQPLQTQPSQQSPTDTETPDQVSLHAYANLVGTQILPLYNTIRANQSLFTQLATSTPPSTIHDGLVAIANMYSQTAGTVQSIKAPAPVSIYSSALVSQYQATATTLKDLADLALQNQTSRSITKSYNTSVLEASRALVGIGNILKTSQVSLQPGEAGYIFLQIIP